MAGEGFARDAVYKVATRGLIRRGGLYEFVQHAWPRLEPGVPFVGGWHIKLICDELELVTMGKTDQLLINVPPGMSKSSIVNVLWPAWEWTLDPSIRWMMSSYDPDLVLRDARRTKALVETPWYQSLWPHVKILTNVRKSADSAGIFKTTKDGLRFSSAIGSRGVGWHAQRHVIDDPHKPLDVTLASGIAMDRAWSWLGLMSTRGVPGQRFARVIIMQRLHQYDMAGRARKSGDWRVVCLPMHYDPDRDDIHPKDRRRRRGELLCPKLKDEKRVEKEARDMRSAGADVEAQHEQRPTPPGGRVFNPQWFRSWDLVPEHCWYVQSWDFTFGARANSWVTGQLWATDGQSHYLVDQVREQTDYPGMKRMLRDFTAKHPYTTTIYVEGAALGKAIIQELGDEFTDLEEVPISGVGGKLVRARAITGTFSDGHVYFPDERGQIFKGRQQKTPWIKDLKKRFVAFTGSDADVADEVDCASQVLVRIHGGSVSRFAKLMGEAMGNR